MLNDKKYVHEIYYLKKNHDRNKVAYEIVK